MGFGSREGFDLKGQLQFEIPLKTDAKHSLVLKKVDKNIGKLEKLTSTKKMEGTGFVSPCLAFQFAWTKFSSCEYHT